MVENIDPNARVGLFGGTFNPLHAGHINAMVTVQSRLKLDEIIVVPTSQNPLKSQIDSVTTEQRLEMLKRGLAEHSEFIRIDESELAKTGASYTIDTINDYSKVVAPENLFLIIGLDQFNDFDRWKDFAAILEKTNLIVVSRPGYQLPFAEQDLPEGLRPLVAAFDRAFIQLASGRTIEFVRLQDKDISATDVRKRLRSGRNVDAQLSIGVEEYIREQNLYAPIGPLIGDYAEFVKFCANVLFERKAINPRAFDLIGTDAASEYALIASGTSTRHAASLAEAVQRAVKDEYNVFPMSLEGSQEGRWVLLDYGSLIVHVFYDFVRQEYRLEDLWKAGKDMNLVDPSPNAPAPVAGDTNPMHQRTPNRAGGQAPRS